MILMLCLSFGAVFAQSAADLKNAGNTAFEAKDFKTALDNYDKAIAAWGSEAPSYIMIYNAGACAYKLKQYPKAIKYFDMVIAGHTETEPASIYKALSYKAMKNEEETIKAYDEGIAKNPESASLKDGLFKYLRAEGKNHYIAGTKMYQATVTKMNAQKAKPTDPAFAKETAKAKTEFNKAIELIKKALAINPDDDEAKKTKAACEESIKLLQ